MKVIYYTVLSLALISVPDFSAQVKKKKIVHKSQWEEWKQVRNGATLSVKWKMKVWISHRSMCQLYSTESIDTRYETHYPVVLEGSTGTLRNDDILIVTGEASGVDGGGSVHLNVTNIVNKGVE